MKEDKLKEVVLVTPLWKSQFWYPMILQMKHLATPIDVVDEDPKMDLSRMEIIDNKRTSVGMNKETIEHLNKAIRSSTQIRLIILPGANMQNGVMKETSIQKLTIFNK
jgi:hypothetical protein